MISLGIIGTAGRGNDATKLTSAHWRMMCCIGQTVATTLYADRVVSGGAAWGDAVAVWLFKQGLVDKLTLHLPAPWEGHSFAETDCGNTANRYHYRAQVAHGQDGLADLAEAINVRCATVTYETAPKGMAPFFVRNTKVARDSHALLAFTLNRGADVGDSGTADTMRKFLARRSECEAKGELHNLRAFHFSLTDHRLYTL